MADQHVPVLVAGGSLVGLTTSALLASYGVPHLLVERHTGTAIHPRAASFHQRTMEIFRSLGLQEAIEAAAEKEFVQNGAIVAVDKLNGKELAFFYRSYNEGVEGLSPTSRLFITQVGLEPVLRRRAQELGAEHLYGTELVGFEQNDKGVVARLRPRDGGAERSVAADFVVGADGAHSSLREQLGIKMVGRGTFADCVTIYFKADVREMIGDRNLSVVYVNHPELLGFFRFSITGDAGFLAVFATIEPDGTRDSHVGQELSTEQCAALVRKALGAPADLPVEVESVQRWAAAASTAEAFQEGRTFLVGDAAHVMPPTGGFGGNTGVADAHNLAWKLAMVVKGRAQAGLLQTYQTERRPIAELTVEQAYARYVLRVDPSLPKDDLATPLDDPSIELGAIYRSSAVIDDDVAGDVGFVEDPRAPSWRPGTRVPHVDLQRDGRALSTLDLAGSDFVVLAGSRGESWVTAAEDLAAATRAPLHAFRVAPDGDLVDAEGRFDDVARIDADGVLLLRPDGVIAWRSQRADPDPRARLAEVVNRLTFG